MKTILCFFTFIICLPFYGQQELTQEDWQSDLRFLQETIHTEYPFLFKKVTPQQFDTAVEELNQAIPALEDHEIVVGFGRIVALFKYGHTDISFRTGPVDFHKLPLVIYEFKDGVYITGTHKDYKEVLGARIVALEGVPIEDVFKAVYPAIPMENDYYFKAYGLSLIHI